MSNKKREYDFALIVGGVPELTTAVEDALYKAGCDDGTVSMRHGRLYIDFSRPADSLKEAVLSAIVDVEKAINGAGVLRVDECDLVTASQIARRMGRTRQLVYQYINGQRGPGGFPPPEYHLRDDAPLWAWGDVSEWLAVNDMIRAEEASDARVVAAVNNWLEGRRQRRQTPELVREIAKVLSAA